MAAGAIRDERVSRRPGVRRSRGATAATEARLQGGGFFLAAGSLTLNNDTISGNSAQGGAGGAGGAGGRRLYLDPELQSFTGAQTGGAGGDGGNGGVATGGGGLRRIGRARPRPGRIRVEPSCRRRRWKRRQWRSRRLFQQARRPRRKRWRRGTAYGGGLYIVRGTISLTAPTIDQNAAVGGQRRGRGPWRDRWDNLVATRASPGNRGRQSESAGKSAVGDGGGIYLIGGAVTWNSATIENNQADNGAGIYNAAILSLATASRSHNNVGSSAGAAAAASGTPARSRSPASP